MNTAMRVLYPYLMQAEALQGTGQLPKVRGGTCSSSRRGEGQERSLF